MTLKYYGYILFLILYIIFSILFLTTHFQWITITGWGMSVVFLTISLLIIFNKSSESVISRSKSVIWGLIIYALILVAANLFVLFSLASYSILMFLNGFALMWFTFDILFSKKSIKPFLRITTAGFLVIVVSFSLPIPGIQTLEAAPPIKFENAGKQGEIGLLT